MTNREIVNRESGADFTPAEDVEELIVNLNNWYCKLFNELDPSLYSDKGDFEE